MEARAEADLEDEELEILLIRINVLDNRLMVGVVYRPPIISESIGESWRTTLLEYKKKSMTVRSYCLGT